jgi:hypothetical protein
MIGIALYLAIGTRTAGIALLAGVVLYDLLKYQTITRIHGGRALHMRGLAIAARLFRWFRVRQL